MRSLLLAVLLTACTTATIFDAVEKPVTDFKQVAGSWNGWLQERGYRPFRVNLIIQIDGQYQLVFERNPSFPGQLTLEGGVLRYGKGTTGFWRGTVTLVEERGKEYLRFVHDDTGALWIEYERAR